MEIDVKNMSSKELKALQAQINLELWKRRLVNIRVVIAMDKPEYKDLNFIMRERLKMLDFMVSKEFNSLKRFVIIENCIEELEMILDIEN